MIDRKELQNKLPAGYQKKVARKAGVSETCVSNYFKGLNNNINVELSVLEILAELSDKRKFLLSKIGKYK
jgi:predicted transcriptional regulator